MSRILCLIENISQGGAERQLIGLATMLAKEGNVVKIIIYHKDMFYLPLLEWTGVECEYLEKASNKLRRIPTIFKYIKGYKPDTVVSFLKTPSLIACLAKMFVGNFRLIVSERNTTQKIALSDKIQFFLYRYADWIVPNSHSQSEFIKLHYPNLMNKTVTITNFVDTEHFCPISEMGTSQNDEPLKMVCVGRVSEQKNVKLFLQAVKKAIDNGVSFMIDWYGLAIHPYYEECEAMVKELDLEKVFSFHEATNDVKSVYQNADVMVLPSIYEGFPNVVCEAMSCGLPVLCSDVCDNGRIVRGGENGILFNPRSIDDMAATIVKFSKLDTTTRNEMGKKSREFAIADFSQEAFFNKYKELIFG